MSITRFSDGDIKLWVDPNGVIHLKAADSFGDPVEISAEDARELGQALVELADQLDA